MWAVLGGLELQEAARQVSEDAKRWAQITRDAGLVSQLAANCRLRLALRISRCTLGRRRR